MEAFWGSGPLQETSADTSAFSTSTPFIRTALTFVYDTFTSVCQSDWITGAPGVAPVEGKPGLTICIMGAPGAPGLHRDRRKEKEIVRHNVGHLMGLRVA